MATRRCVVLPACGLALALVTCVEESSGPRAPGSRADIIDAAASAVLVGAGDIADCTRKGDSLTANLLDDISGTVFAAGDNAYMNGTSAEYANCYEPTWGRHKARTRPVPGNHDYNTSGAAGYFGYFGAAAGDPAKGYYSYDLGAWHIIALNSNIAMGAGSAQEQWLQTDLAAHPANCTLAYWHHPLFSSSTVPVLTAARAAWQDLYDAGAELVINGHHHDYERFAPQTPAGAVDRTFGIREIVVGTGGGEGLFPFGATAPNSEVRDNETFGVLKLTLRARDYDWEFIPVAGKTFRDSGSGACHDAPSGSPPANHAPTAAAGGPYEGVEGAAVSFDGSGSSDPDGDALTYAWSFGDGASGSGARPTHGYADNGAYMVSLTVTDAPGASSGPATTTATIANAAPSVTIPARQSASVGAPFTLTARFSDPGGSDAPWTHTIDWGDGSPPTTGSSAGQASAITASHTYAAAGTPTVRLTVTDKDGGTGAGEASVTVTAANQAPTAAFGASCAALTCAFTDQSTDSDGRVVAWRWDFGDGTSSSSQNPSHTYGADGTYAVRLTVTDDRGGTGSTSQSVTVAAANQPPSASFGASCAALTCAFADQSTDPDGRVVAWRWDFGDGSISSSQNPSHTYAVGGTYTVRLTVTDDRGATDATSKSVTVTAPNQAPSASFAASCSGLACTFSDQSSDPDGRVVAWRWTFGDGTSSSSQNPSHTYGAAGTYTVRLTVTDDRGATDATSKSVTASQPNQAPGVNAGSDATMLIGLYTLRASFSDPDNDGPWAYTIDWGDGLSQSGSTSSQSTISSTHPYLVPGSYRIRVTVTDSHGGRGSDSLTLTVKLLP